MSKFFRRLLGLGCSEQEQGQNQGQYKNIRPQPGTNGRLFFGDLINQEGIQGGGPTSHLLVPDGKGGYRLPTDEEMNAILRRYMRNIEGRK